MKVYLASPFFTKTEQGIYNKIIKRLRDGGHEVFVPQEHKIPDGGNMPNDLWAEAVFAVDYLALCKCEVVVVLNFGMYSDSGTAWECGCAYACGKTIVNVLCGKEEYSLMMLNGTSKTVYLNDFLRWGLSNVLQATTKVEGVTQK